jgi:DNA-binding PadR family transcriptional regulator
MRQPGNLTTTSYVVLGHLALRPSWSTYELAQQMKRSTRHYWPRAESKIYEEPKKLVAHGYATASQEFTGKRPRTVYAITGAGRAALREWLADPGGAPSVEFEGATKVLFAEQASRDELLATIRRVRSEAERTLAEHAGLAQELAAGGGPFPERVHVNELVMKYMSEQAGATLRWAQWAEGQVATWPDDISGPDLPGVGAALRALAGRGG